MKKNTTTVAATLAVAGLLAATPPALAQEDTDKPDTPQQCGAMHMILANGTGDSARHRDPNKDEGFFAQLSTYVMDKVGDTPISADKSGGLADSLTVNAKDSLSPSSAISATSETDEQATDTGADTDTKGATATTASTPDGSDEQTTSEPETAISGAPSDFLDKHNPDENNDQDSAGQQATPSTDSQQGESGTVLPVTRTFVNYPSAAGGFQFFAKPTAPGEKSNRVSYLDSMKTGVESAEEQLKKVSDDCGEQTKFFLAGYSQGAEVIEHVARKIGSGNGVVSPDQIAGVSLFASPNREAATPLAINGADSVGGNHAVKVTEGLTDYDTPAGGGISADKTGTDGFGELEDRTVSWCLQGDLVCGMPVDSEIARALVTSLEGLDVTDPQSSLEEMSDGLNMALTVKDVEKTNPEDIDFGDGGFSLANADMATQDAGESDSTSALSPSGRQSAFRTFIDTTIDTARSGSGSTSSMADFAGGFAGGLSNPTSTSEETPASQQDWQDAGQAAASAAGDTFREELNNGLGGGQSSSGVDRSTSLESRLLNAGAKLGGMALGTGITTVRKTLSPESLASIALAGATGGPSAAAGVAAVNFSKAGMELLEPENASMTVRQGMQTLRDSGLGIGDISELAVALSSWKSLNEHQGYTTRPIMPDGRTALDVTRDWAVAAAADSGAEVSDELAADDEDVIADFRSEPDANGDTVTVDREKLQEILAQLGKSADQQHTSQESNDEQDDSDSTAPTSEGESTDSANPSEQDGLTGQLDEGADNSDEVTDLG